MRVVDSVQERGSTRVLDGLRLERAHDTDPKGPGRAASMVFFRRPGIFGVVACVDTRELRVGSPERVGDGAVGSRNARWRGRVLVVIVVIARIGRLARADVRVDVYSHRARVVRARVTCPSRRPWALGRVCRGVATVSLPEPSNNSLPSLGGNYACHGATGVARLDGPPWRASRRSRPRSCFTRRTLTSPRATRGPSRGSFTRSTSAT